MLTDQDKSKLVKAIADAVISTVKETGPLGAPGGAMYAAFMHHGFTLEQFEKIMDSLVRVGELRRSNNCYFIAKKAVAASNQERDFGEAFDGFRVTSEFGSAGTQGTYQRFQESSCSQKS